MSAALYIVPEKEIAGFDSAVNGKALSAGEAELALITEKLRVTSLMDFFSQSPAETIDFIAYQGGADDDLDVADETWFSPADGLKTTRALLGYLEENPDAASATHAITRELREFETVLQKLSDENVRWHLAVDM